MSNIKWGVLGAANIAYEEVVPAIRRADSSEVVAVASRNKEKAKRFETPEIYDNYNDLISNDLIDAVYIPLPNALHKQWVIKAMESKKHVMVEKPAALSVDDVKEIKQVAEKNNVVFMEAFMYQFNSMHEHVKQIMDSGKIGSINHVKAHFSFKLDNLDDIRMDKALGGGALWDVGCYGVHAVTQIAGIKPKEVTMVGKLHEQKGVDTTSVCFFNDAKGCTAEVTSSFEASFTNRYEIFGEKGAIRVDPAFRPDVSEDGLGKVTLINHDGHVKESETFKSDQYRKQVEHFQHCIVNKQQPNYNVDHTLKVIECIEQAYKSLEQASTKMMF